MPTQRLISESASLVKGTVSTKRQCLLLPKRSQFWRLQIKEVMPTLAYVISLTHTIFGASARKHDCFWISPQKAVSGSHPVVLLMSFLAHATHGDRPSIDLHWEPGIEHEYCTCPSVDESHPNEYPAMNLQNSHIPYRSDSQFSTVPAPCASRWYGILEIHSQQ